MSVWLFVLGSLISSCSVIVQFGITGVVFHNDVMCRQPFYNFSNSDQNEIACKNSLSNVTEWNCSCRSQMTVSWIRISNDGTVAMASLLFIALVLLSTCQLLLWCGNFGKNNLTFSSFELFSLFGFFIIVFVPHTQLYMKSEKTKILVPITAMVMLFDFFTIGLVFQYYSTHSFSLSVFAIVVLVATGTDILLRCLVNYLIRRNFYKTLENKTEDQQSLKQPPAYMGE
jgi:hypothetical protein